MALPKLDTPSYQLTLPISKKNITFRPYLTKEEKLLLMALEAKDSKSIIAAIRQVVTNCIVQPEKFDVDSIPMVDLDYLFLNLRAKSKGETIEANFNCKNEVPSVDNPEESTVCNNLMTLSTRIDNLQVEIPKDFTTTIPLTDKIGVIMRLPTYKDTETITTKEELSPVARTYALIIRSIESVYDGDQVYEAIPYSGELDDFLGSLTKEQFTKVQNFFENSPRINYTFDVKCSKCNFEHKIDYKDIASFF